MIKSIGQNSNDRVPTKPKVGDLIVNCTDTVQVFTDRGWINATHMDIVQIMLSYRLALMVYADPDNWIGNEFWAEGGGDPKRFATEALKKY